MKEVSINKIEIDRVHFNYPKGHTDTVVIADFSLAIQNHEFVTIVGPSGCGKSTLLNIVAGLFPPSGGRVLVDGVPISGPSSDRTMVFQDDAVFPWYTVKQNVEYGLKIAGMEKGQREETVDKNLGMVGLLDSQDKYPRELSGGMRKRVDVARALATAPEIFLMDEPFAALDVMTKEKLQEEFLAIWDELKMTVLFVTHDLEEALYMSDRVLIMSTSPGKIVEVVVSPFSRPRNPDLKTEDKFQGLRRKLAHVIQNL